MPMGEKRFAVAADETMEHASKSPSAIEAAYFLRRDTTHTQRTLITRARSRRKRCSRHVGSADHADEVCPVESATRIVLDLGSNVTRPHVKCLLGLVARCDVSTYLASVILQYRHFASPTLTPAPTRVTEQRIYRWSPPLSATARTIMLPPGRPTRDLCY